MKTVGLTGGIGSGKTTISKVFSVLGVPVFNSDEISKSILFSKEGTKLVSQVFGDEICENGAINKDKLASQVFSDKTELAKLNAILHPLVAKAFDVWKTKQNFPYCIKEAAILFESGAYKSCDLVISVSCSEAERVRRVLKRDQRSLQQIQEIVNKQWSDEERQELADFIINNENQKVLPQVMLLHGKFMI